MKMILHHVYVNVAVDQYKRASEGARTQLIPHEGVCGPKPDAPSLRNTAAQDSHPHTFTC